MQYGMFDNTEIYKSKIAPLVKEVKDLCSTHKIPFFISFTIGIDELGKPVCKRDALTPTALKMEVADCIVYPLICIAAGSKAVPAASEIAEIDFD